MTDDFLNTIGDSFLGEMARGYFWMWPLLENLHFIGLSALMGGLLVVDLRVIGIGPPKHIPMKPALSLIPFVMIAFAINLITGIIFFCGDPFRYYYNLAFQWKIALIVLAGANALWFWFGEHAKLSALPEGADTPISAKVIAGISLSLWIGVIILGRLIPYLE
jgi:hypothetical protein